MCMDKLRSSIWQLLSPKFIAEFKKLTNVYKFYAVLILILLFLLHGKAFFWYGRENHVSQDIA